MKKIFYVIIIAILIIIIFLAVYNSSYFQKILNPIKYQDLIFKYADKYNIDPYLVAAIISVESNFDKNAVSSKRAIGLMQIIPDTAEWIAYQNGYESFSEEILFEPEVNINFGCWYIDNLSKEFGDNLRNILAAYNGGRGNVKKWLNNSDYSADGIHLNNIPFRETCEYVQKVINKYQKYKNIYR